MSINICVYRVYEIWVPEHVPFSLESHDVFMIPFIGCPKHRLSNPDVDNLMRDIEIIKYNIII